MAMGITTLSSVEFAQLTGLSATSASRVLRRSAEGHLWHGARLEVIAQGGSRARSGMAYRVKVSSLPPELRDRIRRVDPIAVPAGDPCVDQLEVARTVCAVGPPRSVERAAAIKAAAEARGISCDTVRRWVAALESRGYAGLVPKSRADRGRRRVKISREWDAATAHLGQERQEEIADRLRQHLASLWRSGIAGAAHAALLASGRLLEWTAEALGLSAPDATLRRACVVPVRLATEQRRFRAAHFLRRDVGLAAAVQTPRVRRSRDHLEPMQWLLGDVHHLDVLVERADADGKVRSATPKVVCFLDVATNRVFGRLFLCPVGTAIRREHVLETLADLLEDPAWGAPQNFYLDNGAEFSWPSIATDLARVAPRSLLVDITTDVAERAGLTLARPYNPQAKGSLEGFFGQLVRRWLPGLSGFIAGDRLAKPTHQQGKAPIPAKGGFPAVAAAFETVLDAYHATVQRSGHLKGRSPNDAIAAWIARGWRATTIARAGIDFAFSKVLKRFVRQGEVTIEGRRYTHPELLPLGGTGQAVLVRLPLIGDRRRVYLVDETGERLIGEAEEVLSVPFDAVDGAISQSRRAGETKRQVRALEGKTKPLSILAETRAYAASRAPAPVPNAPNRAEVHPLAPAAAAAARLTAEPPSRSELPEQYRALERFEARKRRAVS